MQQEIQEESLNVEVCKECRKNFNECGSMQRLQEEFQDHTINVEACKLLSKNFKTRV